MLQRGILNPQILGLIGRVRHTNTLVIADRGFPFWPRLETVDIHLGPKWIQTEVEDELIGIYYLMGRAYEDQGNSADALEFYEKVFSLDINFEDVTERLRALR